MSLSISLLFFIKKSKVNSSGKTTIFLRITLDGRRSEFSIHRQIHVDWWNSKTQLALGNSAEAVSFPKIRPFKNRIRQATQERVQ
jgi:hypothetical protein